MKLADTNVWLALALSKHVFHQVAEKWLESQPATQEILFCRSTQQSFLRLLTTAAVLNPYGLPPLTNAEAWSLYERYLLDPRIAFCEEPPDLDSAWKALAVRDTASPKVWMDAYLAAFAIAGGFQLVTTDHAFGQFAGLDLHVLSAPASTRS